MRTLSIIILMSTLSTPLGCRAQFFAPKEQTLSCGFDAKGNVDCFSDDLPGIADEAGAIAASDTAVWQQELLNKVERDLRECDKRPNSDKALKKLNRDMDELRKSDKHVRAWLKTQEFI